MIVLYSIKCPTIVVIVSDHDCHTGNCRCCWHGYAFTVAHRLMLDANGIVGIVSTRTMMSHDVDSMPTPTTRVWKHLQYGNCFKDFHCERQGVMSPSHPMDLNDPGIVSTHTMMLLHCWLDAQTTGVWTPISIGERQGGLCRCTQRIKNDPGILLSRFFQGCHIETIPLVEPCKCVCANIGWPDGANFRSVCCCTWTWSGLMYKFKGLKKKVFDWCNPTYPNFGEK